MSAADLKDIIEYASAAMTKWFDAKGEIRPMWHAVKRDGDHMIVPAPMHIGKDACAAHIRQLFKDNDVVRCVFVDECWVVHAMNADVDEVTAYLDQHGSLEHHPQRFEVVTFMGEDVEAGMISAERKIIRKPNSRPRLGPLEYNEGLKSSEGRFVGLLPQHGAAH